MNFRNLEDSSIPLLKWVQIIINPLKWILLQHILVPIIPGTVLNAKSPTVNLSLWFDGRGRQRNRQV